jgi:hypothetical protein
MIGGGRCRLAVRAVLRSFGICAALAVAGLSAQRAGQPAQPGTGDETPGLIRGRITAADTGRPLRRARVTLTGDDGRPRSTTTTSDGFYAFAEIPPGRYRLSASHTGHLTLAYGQRRPLEQGRPIDLRPRGAVEDAHLALPPMSVIGGRVTDETGDPIANVSVMALQPRYVDGRRQWVPAAEAPSDDGGRYRLFGVMPGAYLVMGVVNTTWTIREDGVERETGYAPSYLPGVADPSQAVQVSVGVGERYLVADLSMVPARPERVSGVVVNSQGVPSAGETVYLSRMYQSVGGVSMTQMGGAMVRSDGTFVLPGVMPGDYRLAVRDAEGTADTLHIEEAAVVFVSVNGTPIDDLLVVTTGPWAIQGTVHLNSGAVPSPAQGRIRVLAAAASAATDRALGGAPADNGVVDERGGFRIERIFGPVRLNVEMPPGWMLLAIRQAGKDVTDATLEIQDRQTLTDLEVVLTDRVTAVEGQVSSPDGGTGDGTVILFSSDPSRWFPGSRFVRVARPDQAGRFVVQGLPPGSYLAVAFDGVPDGAWDAADYLASVQRFGELVRLDEGGRASVDVRVRPSP